MHVSLPFTVQSELLGMHSVKVVVNVVCLRDVFGRTDVEF